MITSKEAELLLARITPGEWRVGQTQHGLAVVSGERRVIAFMAYEGDREVEDAQLLALAPELARRVIELEKELEECNAG